MLCAAAAVNAQEWTRFHGPNGQGASPAAGIPTTWTEKDYAWNVELPGEGHSQPVLWGDKLFLTVADKAKQNWSILCLDSQTGKTQWKKDYAQSIYRTNKLNSYAAATPCVDEKMVYAPTSSDTEYFLMAWDHAGNEKWRYRMGSYVSQHGTATSPMVYNDLVILSNDQDPDDTVGGDAKGKKATKRGSSYVVAIHKNTGKEAWKLTLNTELTSYTVPAVYQPKGAKPVLVMATKAHGLFAIDPATGKIAWQSPGLYQLRPIMSPIIVDDIIITSNGSGGGKSNYVVGVKITPDGPKEVWRMGRAAPYVPTPVVHNGIVYLVGDGGILTAVNARTGAEKYVARIEGKSGGSSSSFFGSPVIINGHIYVMSRQGDCYVIKASDKYEPVSVIPLGEESHSTPAVANGRLYLRTFNRLMAVGASRS
jgi:outer membrane protein assembly factor BamB